MGIMLVETLFPWVAGIQEARKAARDGHPEGLRRDARAWAIAANSQARSFCAELRAQAGC